jgi:hypothetical protein
MEYLGPTTDLRRPADPMSWIFSSRGVIGCVLVSRVVFLTYLALRLRVAPAGLWWR